jgi:hypothetical protein
MNMLKIITRSGICLHAPWAHAFEIARLAGKLPAHMWSHAVPFTVQPQLEAACSRAAYVLSFNANRTSR